MTNKNTMKTEKENKSMGDKPIDLLNVDSNLAEEAKTLIQQTKKKIEKKSKKDESS
jgi:hypothetical protein